MPAEPGQRADVRPGFAPSKLKDVRPQEYAVRFVLGALVSVGAALVAKATSARLGGVFLAFPAILPASLTLIEDKEGNRRAGRDAIGAVLGGLGLAIFAGIAEASLGRVRSPVALVFAFGAWVVGSLGLYALLAWLRPEACDRHQD